MVNLAGANLFSLRPWTQGFRNEGEGGHTWKREGEDLTSSLTTACVSLPSPHRTRRIAVVESRVGSTTTLAKAIKAAADPPKVRAGVLHFFCPASLSSGGSLFTVGCAFPHQVFVCASGVGYYEPQQTTEGDTVDEGAPPGTDFMARLAVDWETAAAKAASVRRGGPMSTDRPNPRRREEGHHLKLKKGHASRTVSRKLHGRLTRQHKTRVVSMRSGVVLGRSGGAFQQMRLPFLLVRTFFSCPPACDSRKVRRCDP